MTFRSAPLWVAILAILAPTPGAAVQESAGSRISQYLNATPDRREEAAQAVLAAGAAEIPTLLDEYARGSAPIQQLVADLLPRFGPSSFEALYDAGYRDVGSPMMGKENVMWQASIDAVTRMGPEVFAHAIEILEEENPGGHRWAFAARVLESSEGIPLELIEKLLSHREWSVRDEGARLLGLDGSEASIRRLVALAESKVPRGRFSAVRALSYSQSPLGVPTFLLAMREESEVARQHAAVGLGKHYERRFRVPLARMARNDDAGARIVACNVLTASGDTPMVSVSGRYLPIGAGPLRVIRMENVAVLKLGFSGVLAIILGVLTRYTDKRRPFGYLGLVVLGLTWGAWVGNMWWVVETAFIFAVVPAMILVGAFIERPRPFWHGIRTRWSKLGGVVYAAYFVGQTWLWGGSIEWLRLWLPASVAW